MLHKTNIIHKFFGLFSIVLLVAFGVFGLVAQAQDAESLTSRAEKDFVKKADEQPLYRDYKGVQIGMSAEEARKKLGEPADKSDKQDFYAVSDKETVQIFYDAALKVKAVSVSYLGDGAPKPVSVINMEIEPKADGSMYKLVEYEKTGYWVSYSRTGGDSPLVTVSMQKSRK